MSDRPIPSGDRGRPSLEGMPRAELGLIEEAQPRLVDAALRGPLVLTRHGRDAFVILPVDLYDRLARDAAEAKPGRTVLEG